MFVPTQSEPPPPTMNFREKLATLNGEEFRIQERLDAMDSKLAALLRQTSEAAEERCQWALKMKKVRESKDDLVAKELGSFPGTSSGIRPKTTIIPSNDSSLDETIFRARK